jgi:hypothetical protein
LALAAIADELARRDCMLSAFYTSNVEEYLFQERRFGKFAENVRRFAISERSVFIRSLRGGWAERHPANVGGFSRTSLLAPIARFLQDYNAGACSNYWKLVNADYLRMPRWPRDASRFAVRQGQPRCPRERTAGRAFTASDRTRRVIQPTRQSRREAPACLFRARPRQRFRTGRTAAVRVVDCTRAAEEPLPHPSRCPIATCACAGSASSQPSARASAHSGSLCVRSFADARIPVGR